MIILRQKMNSSIYNIDGQIMNGATDNVQRSQSYYDSLAKDLKAGNSGGLSGTDPNAVKLGSNSGVRTLGGGTRYDNELKTGDVYDMGMKKGQQSVGLKQGAMNTWNNMSKTGKIATGVAAGALALGTTAMVANSIKNKRKAKKAEERAKAAEARARY